MAANHLCGEKSPYILQHLRNPVDWYPWGEAAFSRARELNKPIFLSVGYSTCHWCHVMEKESFENEETAALMNEHFISIKVDREERPDVDKLYMSYVQAVSGGSGGWPMSVFLTPDLEPITGGTYFPPIDRYGQMGFPTVLKFIAEKWRADSSKLKDQASSVMSIIGKSTVHRPGDAPPSDVVCRATFQHLKARFDEERGGFGDAPKFPKPVDLHFLLDFAAMHASRPESKEALRMLKQTLNAITLGGIHDHVGKGFHRYSVDGGWHVPHFEKMAYDQGQLMAVYADYALLTGDAAAKEVVRDIVGYVDENLTQKDGGFWSAEDADSLAKPEDEHKREGAFAVWEKAEIEEVLQGIEIDGKRLSDIVCAYFGVEEHGNAPPYTDPHDELKNQNILIMHSTHEEMCEILGMKSEHVYCAIQKAKTLLAARRALRPKPHLDSKMVTSIQGLLISGYAKAAMALEDHTLSARAHRAVEFVRRHLTTHDGRLYRAVYTAEDGSVDQGSRIAAFADDYASLVAGLLDLYEATLDETLLEMAEKLQMKMDELFWECDTGYFISEAGLGERNVRMIEEQDGAEPSASSTALGNVVRLAELLDSEYFRTQADKIVACASQRLTKYPFILAKMLTAYARLESGGMQIVIAASSDDAMQPLLDAVHSSYIWNGSITRVGAGDSFLRRRVDLLKEYETTAHSQSVFICENRVCGLPLKEAADIKETIAERTGKKALAE